MASLIACHTADAQVDAAASLLRLLFVQDLRRLQTEVDAALVAVQVRDNPLHAVNC
jgi:hypothetical protein